MAPKNKLSIAKAEIAELDNKIAKLETLRHAWRTIVAAEQEASPNHDSVSVGVAMLEPHRRTKGEKAAQMREFITSNTAGVSRAAVVQRAKEMGTSPNFGYKFVDRMKESGELQEVDGRLFATDQMRSRIRIVAEHRPTVFDNAAMREEPA